MESGLFLNRVRLRLGLQVFLYVRVVNVFHLWHTPFGLLIHIKKTKLLKWLEYYGETLFMIGPNRTCLGEFDITMESGLFLDSQVEI
jgi:hypothetical protein